jgi:hypothetical protein
MAPPEAPSPSAMRLSGHAAALSLASMVVYSLVSGQSLSTKIIDLAALALILGYDLIAQRRRSTTCENRPRHARSCAQSDGSALCQASAQLPLHPIEAWADARDAPSVVPPAPRRPVR